jgi:hypothetical protein
LTFWVSSRLEELGDELPELTAEDTFDRQFRGDASTSGSRNASARAAGRKNQLQYVNALNRQVKSALENTKGSEADGDETKSVVRIRPPADTGRRLPVRQGPFLLRPAPRELDEVESTATDLHYFSYASPDDGSGSTLGIFLIASSSGKVDIGLEVEKIEAMWQSSNYNVNISKHFFIERICGLTISG